MMTSKQMKTAAKTMTSEAIRAMLRTNETAAMTGDKVGQRNVDILCGELGRRGED